MRGFPRLHIIIHSDASYHITKAASFVVNKASNTIGYGYCARHGKAQNGECQIRMSHYVTFFALKHKFSPFLELFISFP